MRPDASGAAMRSYTSGLRVHWARVCGNRRALPLVHAIVDLSLCVALRPHAHHRLRARLPVGEQEPDQLEALKQELAATQQALEEIETRISTPASLEEAEQVEASLKEALAQIQERKKTLQEQDRKD